MIPEPTTALLVAAALLLAGLIRKRKWAQQSAAVLIA